jgi:steroid 5-alpha reductase family enzyme
MYETLLINTFLFSLIIFSLATIVFLVAQLKKDNSIMDIVYGPLFAIGAWSTLIITESFPPLAVLIASLTTLWAARLALRIGRKNWGKPEDQRYRAWREAWMQRGYGYFLRRSYLQINLLQGLVVIIVSLPFLVTLSAPEASGTLYTVGGILLMLCGLTYESIADWQLDRFIARKKAGIESSPLMTRGLFRYSRRPNYFGEALIWWGMATIAYPLPAGFVAFFSPLLITYILTRVTGPMLEKIFLEKNSVEYRAYMASTNFFIPGRPKA